MNTNINEEVNISAFKLGKTYGESDIDWYWTIRKD